jgi:hypothetical protein
MQGGKGLDGEDPDKDVCGLDSGAMVRQFSNCHQLKTWRLKKPEKLIKMFRSQVLEDLRVKPGDVWSYHDWW